MQFPEVIIKKTITAPCASDEPSACEGILRMYLDIMRVFGASVAIVNNRYGVRCPPGFFPDGSADAYTIVVESSASGYNQGVSIDVTVSLNRPLSMPSRRDSVPCLNPLLSLPKTMKDEIVTKLEEIWKDRCGLPPLSYCPFIHTEIV